MPTINSVIYHMKDFRKRLIAQGYSETSVDTAVNKTARLAVAQILVDELNVCGAPQVLLPHSCRNCELYKEGASRRVPGHGNANSPIMFVGEGPGEHEDIYGVPFVGIAGITLTMWLEKMPLKREQVYITNIIKCRLYNNRTPSATEVWPCINKHLLQEIALVKPKIIVAVGKPAMQALTGTTEGITKLRGTWMRSQLGGGIPVLPVFHPAYVLRQKGSEFLTVNHLVYCDLVEAYSKL